MRIEENELILITHLVFCFHGLLVLTGGLSGSCAVSPRVAVVGVTRRREGGRVGLRPSIVNVVRLLRALYVSIVQSP